MFRVETSEDEILYPCCLDSSIFFITISKNVGLHYNGGLCSIRWSNIFIFTMHKLKLNFRRFISFFTSTRRMIVFGLSNNFFIYCVDTGMTSYSCCVEGTSPIDFEIDHFFLHIVETVWCSELNVSLLTLNVTDLQIWNRTRMTISIKVK